MNFLFLNHIISLAICVFITTSIGLFILWKSRGNKINRWYAFALFSVAWTMFFVILGGLAGNHEKSYKFYNLVYCGFVFISVFKANFIILLLDIKKRWHFIFLRIGYILSGVFIISSFIPNITPDVRPVYYLNYYPGHNIWFDFYFAIFLIYASYIILQLIISLWHSSGSKRNQIAYLLIATMLGYTGGLSLQAFFFGIAIPILQPFAFYLLSFYSIFIAYAILKYQLMDIKVAIKKTFFYSIGIAVASGCIVAISFLSNWFNNNIPGFKSWTIPLIAGASAFVIGRIFWMKSQEADKIKYEFITVAAHKLRTPLTEIRWGADALNDEIKSTEFDKDTGLKLVSGIKSADLRLIELTEELLAVSKTELNQYQYKFGPANLEKIVRAVVNSFQLQMKEKNIKLYYNIEKGLPPANLDKTRISSVIQILFENAILYTKDEIKINIDSYKNNVIFHVEDNGIGIKKEDQPYIFSKFYRSHGAYLTETEGTGIGLFLAKSIIDKHNGKIGVKSEGEGQGSVFWFSLKAA